MPRGRPPTGGTQAGYSAGVPGVEMSDDERDEPTGENEKQRSRLRSLGRRLMNSGEDVRELAGAFIETSDRAKTEMVKMVAREVRTYLDELRLKEEIIELARSHSLEVKLSLHLKPLLPDPLPEAVVKKPS